MLLPELPFILCFHKLLVDRFIGKVLAGVMDLLIYLPEIIFHFRQGFHFFPSLYEAFHPFFYPHISAFPPVPLLSAQKKNRAAFSRRYSTLFGNPGSNGRLSVPLFSVGAAFPFLLSIASWRGVSRLLTALSGIRGSYINPVYQVRFASGG